MVTNPNAYEKLSRNSQRVSPVARAYHHATGILTCRLLPQFLRTVQHSREQTQRGLRLVRHSRHHFLRRNRHNGLVASQTMELPRILRRPRDTCHCTPPGLVLPRPPHSYLSVRDGCNIRSELSHSMAIRI